jgi:hypothetical protein
MKNIELFLNSLRKKLSWVGSGMSKINSERMLFNLKFKAKVSKLWKTNTIQTIASFDMTFIFLFLSLYLFGYAWRWETFLASIGLWIVAKEVFKHIKIIAASIGLGR